MLADFYLKRFRAEFKPAVDAWIATDRSEPDGAADAVRDAAIRARFEPGGGEARGASRDVAAEGRTNVQRATNYVLGVVLFAAALFFAGMSTKLSTRRLRIALLAVSVTVFVVSVIWIATLPISISV